MTTATLDRATVQLTSLANHVRARLVEIDADGALVIEGPDNRLISCDWLESGRSCPELVVGDLVLAALSADFGSGVVLGRVGRYRRAEVPTTLVVEASSSLTLRCGQASVELRADGRAAVKGEEVLVRAKGTQRIRAGHVAIN